MPDSDLQWPPITVKLRLDSTEFEAALGRTGEEAQALIHLRLLRTKALTDPVIDGQLKALGLG